MLGGLKIKGVKVVIVLASAGGFPAPVALSGLMAPIRILGLEILFLLRFVWLRAPSSGLKMVVPPILWRIRLLGIPI